ncbi:hypothetical protein [Microbacterium sp. 2FI]|uniref:hypothetical protein n=1 Tax=Microbacterium sp. 2FI TaxID=2502193 RepID=UPI0010F50388|nr:hypothetical protein [Microbacterium sp. 2FI]
MTRELQVRPVRARETSISTLPVALQQGADEWRRWRVWIVAGPILFGLCCGLLVVAIEVTR